MIDHLDQRREHLCLRCSFRPQCGIGRFSQSKNVRLLGDSRKRSWVGRVARRIRGDGCFIGHIAQALDIDQHATARCHELRVCVEVAALTAVSPGHSRAYRSFSFPVPWEPERYFLEANGHHSPGHLLVLAAVDGDDYKLETYVDGGGINYIPRLILNHVRAILDPHLGFGMLVSAIGAHLP